MKLLRFLTKLHLVLAITTQGVFAKADASHPPRVLMHPPPAAVGVSLRPQLANKDISLEVTGFEAENAQQSAVIISGLIEQMKQAIDHDPHGRYEVYIRMGDGTNPNDSQLDYEAFSLGQKLADADHRVKLSSLNIPKDEHQAQSFYRTRWFEKSYRMTFALVRGAISTGATTWTLLATPHLSLESSMSVGLIAGSMSFALQYWSKDFYNWATDTKWAAKAYRSVASLLSRRSAMKNKNNEDSVGVTFMHKAEAYVRCYAAEVAYVMMLKSGMSLFGVDHDFHSMAGLKKAMIEDVLPTSIYSTFSQDSWDLAITNARKKAERERILTQNRIDFYTNLKYLTTAAVSMALMAAKLMHVPYVDQTYLVLTATGGITYLGSIWYDAKSRKFPPDPATSQRKILDCKILLSKTAG